MKNKYIVVEALGINLAIILPGAVTHAHAINTREIKPLSAGFFELNNGCATVELPGGSSSLDLRSRPEDAEIIEHTLLLMGLLPAVAEECAETANRASMTLSNEKTI